MDTLGRHYLLELHGCDPQCLSDVQRVRALLLELAASIGARVVGELFHGYRPQGVTGIVLIQESHLSVHTWPEARYAACDFYTCGLSSPEAAFEALSRALGAVHRRWVVVERGLPWREGALRVLTPPEPLEEGRLPP